MEVFLNTHIDYHAQTKHNECFKHYPDHCYQVSTQGKKKHLSTFDSNVSPIDHAHFHPPSPYPPPVPYPPHPPQQYPKISTFRKRKNPHHIRRTTYDASNQPVRNPENDLVHLLQRREDGKSIHTPLHIQEWEKRHQHYFDNHHGRSFNIVKVRHESNTHHDQVQIKQDTKRQHNNKRRAAAKKKKLNTSLTKPRPILKRTNGKHSQDSSHIATVMFQPQRRLLAPTTRAPTTRAPTTRVPNTAVGPTPQCDPPNTTNCLFYGWGAKSEPTRKSRKKLAGPSLVQALALSPRAYPERLPKNLIVRRLPQEQYRMERRHKLAAAAAAAANAHERRNEQRRQRNRRRPSANLLSALKKSVLVFPPLTSRRAQRIGKVAKTNKTMKH